MRQANLLLSLGLLVTLASGGAAAQTLFPAQSEISFGIKQMGVPVEGKFAKFDAQFAFEPRKPEAGKVSFSIDTGSARFGSAETDAELPKAAWFSAAKFPKATFESTAIKAAGPGKFEVSGKLSLKGSVREVVVPVSLTQAGSVSTAVGSFTLKRLEFKIGEGEWADTSFVANEVTVKFKLALTGMAPL
jgi:polyisoprenoid-binding protein YceI